MRSKVLALLALCAAAATAFAAGPSFLPDFRFSGSSISNLRTVGGARWTASNGTVTAAAGDGKGGLLLFGDKLQDVSLYTGYRCDGPCEAGIVMRAEPTDNGGMKGVYVSLTDPAVASYNVIIAADGSMSKKDKLPPGGGLIRVSPETQANAGVPGAGGPRAPRPQVQLPLTPTNMPFKTGEWNEAAVFLDANTLRTNLNDGFQRSSRVEDGGYGPVGLYVSGNTSVQFRDVSYMDMALHHRDNETVGAGFRKQRLSDFYYSWGVAAGDFNHDGVMDVSSGPYIFFGPDYKTSREIFYAQGNNPITEFSTNMEYAADFTGDGWPDLIIVSFGGGNNGVDLYVNPKGEKRRWEKFAVGSGVQSEDAIVRDIDGDGKPELVYMGGGMVRYAKPDPANPTGKWKVTNVSTAGYGTAHGIGVGDVNGDGRLDLLNTFGWWERPAANADAGDWKYHPQAFGKYERGIVGGANMAVYDVNGDGKNDVVTALDAHGWGLSWFEQKSSGYGESTFVEHPIMGDLSTKTATFTPFSELHATAMADVDGDGIPDFVTGKRWFSHLDTNIDPDPQGAPVLYWFKTIRDPKAPGGARFEPRLIDTHEGVGSDIVAQDLNGDGAVDIAVSTRFGAAVYWGTPKRAGTVRRTTAAK